MREFLAICLRREGYQADKLPGVSDGIRYRVRHDLSAKLIAMAWFGDAGPATGPALASLPAHLPLGTFWTI